MFLWHLSLGFSSPSLDNGFDFTFVPSGACRSSSALWCVSKGRISATFPLLQNTQALITCVKGGLCPDGTRGNNVWGRGFGWCCSCTDVSILSHVLWSKKRVRQCLNKYGLWGGFKFSWSSHQHLSDAYSGEQLGFIATSARGRDKLHSGGEKLLQGSSGNWADCVKGGMVPVVGHWPEEVLPNLVRERTSGFALPLTKEVPSTFC